MPGLPTALPAGLSAAVLDAYVIHLRVEELSRKLRTGHYLPREKRSVSPDPVYDSAGKRTNTRDARYRDKLEQAKVTLVEHGLRTIPGFRPPHDYKRQQKLQEKVTIHHPLSREQVSFFQHLKRLFFYSRDCRLYTDCLLL
jgi:splicing factor 1